MKENLGSSPRAQAILSFGVPLQPEPVAGVGDWVGDGARLLLGEEELWGVLVGWEAGVFAGGEVEDLGLHCAPRLPRFFLAIPW